MARAQHSNRRPSAGLRNVLALFVAFAAVGFGYLNFDPLSIGGDPRAAAASSRRSLLMADMVPVSVPDSDTAQMQEADALGPADSASDSSSGSSAGGPTSGEKPLTGVWALRMTSELLQRGCKLFEHVPDYTASMYKQERIGGVLSDGQDIELKVKHAPFSVYMKWLTGDRGRQLIYVEGKNDGKLLVQPGGIKGRLTGVMHLDPEGDLAMSECRYPVTKVGLLALARIILDYQTADLKRGSGCKCQLEDGHVFDDRPCYLFVCEYETPDANPLYRKSVMYIDKELSMPVCVKNFTWARDANPETLDEETLIEFYSYTNVEIEADLEQTTFAEDNPDYRLRIRR